MSKHYDTLETRSPAEREKALMQALPQQIANAKENAPFFAAWLKDVDPASVTSRAALARLPVLRKSMLGEVQKKQPPMGGLITVPMSKVRHVFMSPGPIFEIDTDEPDYFRGARAMHAGGFRPGDVVYNTFSYHLTPAGIMMESALRALGCAVVPGGVGNTELQLDAIAAIRPTGYVGTPSFLKILIEKAAELGKDISSIKHAFVGAEALPPSLRQMFIDKGMTCLQSYGTADLGTIAYESEAHRGHDRRRGRDRRDRAARHRRSGARGRCRRGRGHDLQPRLSADPLRHRRHVGGAGGRQPVRAHQHAHQGLDGPRRPAHQGARHVRRSRADRRDFQEASRPGPPAPGHRLGQPGRRR